MSTMKHASPWIHLSPYSGWRKSPNMPNMHGKIVGGDGAYIVVTGEA